MSNVFPCNIMNYFPHSRGLYTPNFSKPILTNISLCPCLPNFYDIFFCEFSTIMLFAASKTFWMYVRSIFIAASYRFWMCICSISVTDCGTSFMVSVRNIIGMCSKKQMIRIYTPRMITMMANAHSFWDRSNKKFICCTMCVCLFFIKPKESITVLIRACDPFPAFIRIVGFFNFFKKAFFDNNVHLRIVLQGGL